MSIQTETGASGLLMQHNSNISGSTDGSKNNTNNNDNSTGATNSLSMEPNPFEQSFAKNESSASSSMVNMALVLNAPQIQLPAGSPPVLTPGGRRHILPPLPLVSPNNALGNNNKNNNVAASQNNSLPETPGLMWSSLMNSGASYQPGQQLPNNANMNMYNTRRTGLTPNESSMRTGLTPGGTNFLAGIHLPGLNTPSSLLNTPSLTPGLGSLLDISHIGHNNGSSLIPQLTTALLQLQLQLQQQVQQPQHHPQETVMNGVIHQPALIPETLVHALGAHARQLNGVSLLPRVKRDPNEVSDAPPKKQRGRKPKIKLESQDPEDDSDSSTSNAQMKRRKKDGPMTEEEKRKNFLERNRVAASKCRQRKKQLVNQMKDELEFYSSEHSTLTNQVNTLREQVITLRTILYAHKECRMLLENVGGYDTLNTILNATNYASQIAPQLPLEPTIVPHTTTIAPIEEQNKLHQELLNNTNPSIAAVAAVAASTNNALNHLNHLKK